MAVSDFGAPIPGNSLFTHAPGERPWERPVDIDKVEDAISYYMTSLSQEDIMDDLMVAIEAGVAINPISEAITLSQVMRGKHNLDVALLVKPVVMEFLAAVAESNEIDYKFSNKDPQAELDAKERSRVQMILQGALTKAKEEGGEDAGTALLGEISEFLERDVSRDEVMEAQDMPAPEPEDIQQVNEPPAEAPQEMGLMARR
jgi:hypothetical protein|tara:strand:- start:332 stop:937 length:606 start_codon:yes stop_codon:yes gene_type:complete